MQRKQSADGGRCHRRGSGYGAMFSVAAGLLVVGAVAFRVLEGGRR